MKVGGRVGSGGMVGLGFGGGVGRFKGWVLGIGESFVGFLVVVCWVGIGVWGGD